jgi:hypothetical protein
MMRMGALTRPPGALPRTPEYLRNDEV